ncbi:MAG: hypothetical protein ACYCSH_13195, partial [Acidithiobacillus sp.]
MNPMPLIFAYDHHKGPVHASVGGAEEGLEDIPQTLLREDALHWPNPSELEVLRHYTRLSQRNFSIDTHFYPLGSCTMKYNPRIAHEGAMLAGFAR